MATAMAAKTIREAVQRGKIVSDGLLYTFLKLPVSEIKYGTELIREASTSSSSSSSFKAFLVDKDEITVMVPTKDYEKYHDDKKIRQRPPIEDGVEKSDIPYRLITFDVVLDPNLIGFMSEITKILASHQISVLPFAAYSRDHIFVQDNGRDYEKAVRLLTTAPQKMDGDNDGNDVAGLGFQNGIGISNK